MLPLFRIYHAGLRYDDVFRLPEAHAILARTAALSAHELKDLPHPRGIIWHACVIPTSTACGPSICAIPVGTV